MGTRTTDCRKFTPNIFNKSKCSHCFRQREEHSAAALECNRASRKISKCGYLFVAPDWDFNNPLYRTKRWQRRWFVLYDDGELTYSVDEHPETIPQASVDMTRVIEVTTAEDITGHTNSIAITAPDRVTFVKGTCLEESKWWLNILQAFPKSKGRHKRNATFPGGQTKIVSNTTNTSTTNNNTGNNIMNGNRHNSYHKDVIIKTTTVQNGKTNWKNEDDDDDDDDNCSDDDDDDNENNNSSVPGTPTDGQDENNKNVGNEITNRVYNDQPVSSKSPPTRDKIFPETKAQVRIRNRNRTTTTTHTTTPTTTTPTVPSSTVQDDDCEPASSSLLIEDVRRDEKLKDIANTLTNLSQKKSRWSSNNNNNNINNNNNNNTNANNQNNTILLNEKPTRDETDYYDQNDYYNNHYHHHQQQQHHHHQQQQHKVINMRPKSLPLASNSAPAIVSAIVKKIPTVTGNSIIPSSTSTLPTKTSTTALSAPTTAAATTTATTVASTTTVPQSPQTTIITLDKIKYNNLRQHQQQNKAIQIHPYNRNMTSVVATTTALTTTSTITPQLKHQQQCNERGDPDGGCNLDDLSTNYLSKNSELRVNLPAEEVLNSKKGWLMKQDTRTGEWTKHWFTLRGAALFFYRDPVSEERGVLDGVLDVNSLTNILEIATTRNFGFQLLTWDNRRITLASISANSRTNWIKVLRNAANLPSLQQQPISNTTTTTQTSNTTVTNETNAIDEVDAIKDNNNNKSNIDIKSEIEKDFIKAQRNQEILMNLHEKSSTLNGDTVNNNNSNGKLVTPLTASTPPAASSMNKTVLFSSDEEYRTASEGGRRESIDWGSPLSPSPPIPINIFRTKDRCIRSRTGSSPRLHKRSRSSPPSSRRSTVDSIGSDELLPIIHPVEEELNIDKELQIRLSAAEKERDLLREEAKERESRMSELLITLERTELQVNARIREMEEAKNNLSKQLHETNCNADEIVNRLRLELEDSQKKILELEDRLARGIEENDLLYKKLREGNSSSLTNLNRIKIKRVDSLSDLTNLTEIDPYCLDRDMLADEYHEIRSRFEKAVNEIKAMKKELKESQNQFDTLEISFATMKQDSERRGIEDRSQLQMMAERIQDLTLKYTNSERLVRTLKQKLAKSERRRSVSLKGKEQLSLAKEIEVKVNELETKVEDLEKSSPEKSSHSSNIEEKASSSVTKRSSAHFRRRSLETSASADSLQFMLKLNELEKRIENASSTCSITESSLNSSSTKLSEHLVDRLKCLEGILVTSKDKIEQSLHQLQSLRSSRTRRSVSPITDRKDSFRFVERCLTEVIKLIRESCETCVVGECNSSMPGVVLLPENNPIKLALMQLEGQLRNKLSDLLKQRRVLREHNELTSRKDLELLAERIAFESVCFGKLRDSVSRAENPTLFGEQQTCAEIAETSQLMSMLKAKLSGKCAFKPNGSVDVLAGVLARRLILSSYKLNENRHRLIEMPPVDKKIIENLLRQQNEINLIAKRYKNNAMETLASGLAAETLSYISSNDAVQGVVQEAWRQAQETVNAELVQSEIAHIMLRNAERFETSITPSFGYTLTSDERLTFESFADAVNDSLRKEMNNAIEQLTRCYEESLQKMKRGQWRLHMEHEHKASEGRQLLAEFADIVAHKALVDARVAVLKGDYDLPAHDPNTQTEMNLNALLKYENLFDELAADLQINNAKDILAEADFKFIYKKRTIDFLHDKQHMKEISLALTELEESLVILHSNLSPNTSITMIQCDLNNYKEICFKCRDLRNRVDSMMNSVQKLTEPCEHCEQMETNLCKLANQHETELINLQNDHEKSIAILRNQIDGHLKTINALEMERNSIIEEMAAQTNVVEDHERELAIITNKLKSKEIEYHQKDIDNLNIKNRLQEHENHNHNLMSECEKLTNKCSRQDEEYAALLQERDYIQNELKKERERSRKLEKRLEMLELEHSKQLECLQEAYRDQILTHCSDISGIPDEESFRQRYQTEIEQLRTLCEKGLAAMESSHRRIIGDLEERHRVEIERLLFEKEQALAEETQATLAALDAMRKAHQSEVQREVARFKQEFLRQFQKGESCGPVVREKEEELEELREEILSFSEKYSIKCVENAALEEKLRTANQKLKHLQQMQQLELRNKQFRAHLASEDLSDTNFVQGLSSSSKDDLQNLDSEHDCDDMMSSFCYRFDYKSLNKSCNAKMPTTTTITTSAIDPLLSTRTSNVAETETDTEKNYHTNLLPILLSSSSTSQLLPSKPPSLPTTSPPQSPKLEHKNIDCDLIIERPTRNFNDDDDDEGLEPTTPNNSNDITCTRKSKATAIATTEAAATVHEKPVNENDNNYHQTTTITGEHHLKNFDLPLTSNQLLLTSLTTTKSPVTADTTSSSLKISNLRKKSMQQQQQIDSISSPAELPKISSTISSSSSSVSSTISTTTSTTSTTTSNSKTKSCFLNSNPLKTIKLVKLNTLQSLKSINDHNHHLNNYNQHHHHPQQIYKFNQNKKLAFNLNSFSEFIEGNNTVSNNCNNSTASLTTTLHHHGKSEKIRKISSGQSNDNNGNSNNNNTNNKIIKNCDNDNNNIGNNNSTTVALSSPTILCLSKKICSPSPLSGRDVEHHLNGNFPTSNMRRFELEI